jgi:hypothetical protein
VLEDALDAGIPREALNLGCCRLQLPISTSSTRTSRC